MFSKDLNVIIKTYSWFRYLLSAWVLLWKVSWTVHSCFAHGEVSYSLLPRDQKPDPAGWVSKYKRCLMWGFVLQRSALCWLYSVSWTSFVLYFSGLKWQELNHTLTCSLHPLDIWRRCESRSDKNRTEYEAPKKGACHFYTRWLFFTEWETK